MASVKLTGKASDFLKIGVAAAGRGDLNGVKELLDLKPQWLTGIGSHGRTMLWEAAYKGKTAVVDHLIEAGADLEAHGCHFTPLLVEVSPMTAAKYKKHAETAELLKTRGARTDIFNETFLGNAQYVLAALEADASLAHAEKPQHDHNVKATALHYATSTDQVQLFDLLLSYGADPRPYAFWLTRFTIWRRNAPLLERLFAAGVKPEPTFIPRSGIQDERVAEVLKQHGIKQNPDRAEGGWPPLVFHSRGDRGGNVDRIRSILQDGADVNVINYKGQSALHCASKAGFIDIVELLIERGADVNMQDADGTTPLMMTLQSTVKKKENLVAVAKTLISAGADVAVLNNRGRSVHDLARRKRDEFSWLEVLSAQQSQQRKSTSSNT